jgi:type II secretion system protein H
LLVIWSRALKPRTTTLRPSQSRTAARRADSGFNRRGFSLVELVIVLVIIATVSAIAIPRYSSAAGTYRADMAARRLASDIALAQSQARTTGQLADILFAAGSSTYALVQQSGLDGGSRRFKVNLAAEPFMTTMESVQISDAGSTLTFDGYGKPTQGARIVLNSAGHQRVVTIDQSSGAINVTSP